MLGASVSVTGIAMLGGRRRAPVGGQRRGGGDGDTAHDSTAAAGSVLAGAATTPSADPSTQPRRRLRQQGQEPARGHVHERRTPGRRRRADTGDPNPPVPDDSGDGRRIVFDQSDQRVWLVDDDEDVERTYLVSGSLYDNLEPGTYSVYSRSEQAWGIDDSGTMKYFVRFTEGTNGAAIGFHDIPIDDGELVQTVDELGTPQSHGCVRQERDDAIALWEFAPIGTEVDVTA